MVIERIIGKYIDKKIKEHEKDYHNPETFKSCEICGNLIAFGNATIGKPEIRTRRVYRGSYCESLVNEDYVYYPYYCKVHAPTKEEV
jgi:hypothetical protein